jgi:hypothetical protein
LVRLTPGTWVVLALLVGAAPWVILGVLQIIP